MAVVVAESNSDLRQLFQIMSPCFTPEESENVLLSLKQSYGGKFNSLDNSDLLKCFHLLEKHGYVSENNLKLIEDFIALKSKKRVLIEDAIKSFKASHPVTADQEKRLRGRKDEITKINRKLESKDSAALNLYGSSGVGKTKLAKEVCSQWRGIYRVFDLRKAKDMRAIYYSILHILELPVPVGYVELKNVVAKVQEKIEELQSKREGHAVLFMLDNVDRFTAGEGKEGKNLKTAFTQFLEKLLVSKDKRSKLKLLLTSRTQLRDSKRVENFEVKPLKRSFSEKILFPAGTHDVQPHQMDKFIQATKGSPLFLEILDPILRQGRKSVDDLIVRLTLTPKKSKVEEDASEKPFDFEEDGVDLVQMFVMRESFDTLPTESLKVSAVVISLFHGPFTVLTAAKVLGIDQSEAIALLEGLVASRIIFVVDEEAKERKYDIHPLLQKYADSITSQENFRVPYLEAKARFYELFMHRMEEIAKYIEPDYVKAFHLFETDRGNYEFTVDISLQPEYFSVPGEFHKNALIASLFEAMLNDKQIEVFHSWAEKCEEDGKTGSLTRAQLKCWEAKQVLDVHGTEKALGVLATAFCSLEEVRDKSSNFFKLTKGLYLYSEGEILWRNGAFQKALKSLESSLEFSESLLKEHTTLARCYNAIGNCYSSLEEEVKALEFYNKAYNMQKKLAGSEHHFDIPIYKNQIGAAYVGQGEFKKATKCYKDALSLLKELKLLGSWDEAQFLRNLANAYIHREKYEKAVEPADRAFAIRMKILENHPLTVQSKYQQALIQWYLNEDEKSLQLFLEAWKMEKALDAGNHSPVWQDIIANVETLYDSLRKRNRKKQFRKEALEFCEQLWEERKSSALFCFDGFDKEIIDTILQLLGDKKDKYHVYKAEKEQLSEIYSAAKEDFQEESDKTQSVPHHLLAASEGDKVPDTKSKDGEDEEEEIEVEISDEEDTTPNPADTKKTVIKRDRITDKGDTWNLPEAGAFITFCPGIMKEPLWICCSLWSPRSLSPPIDSNELLVSNVIELSHDGPPTLESMEDATGSITVGLLHSASDFKGYEVVIKTLVDPESNEWYDLETRIVWDTAEMRPAISKWTCPYAEATSTITRFSSFAVIWRLKSFTFPKPNSMIPEFICSVPDYPNVSIVIPWNSLPESTDFCLTLKIQEPPSTDHKREEVLVGPILHVLCSHEVKLSEPAKINLPLEFFEGKRELVHSGQWRIFHFQQKWADITDQLEMSVSLSDGIVTFKVKAFCRFWPLIATVNAGDISNLDRRSMRQRAGFLACICRDDERFLLKLFCFPLNWKSKVNEYISCYNVIYQGDGNSKKPLFNEDQTFVSLSEGLKAHGEKNIEDLSLTFFGDGVDQENVYVTIRDKSNMSVDFLKWLNAEGKRDPEWICKVPMIRRFSPQDPSSCSQYIPCKTLLRKTEMMRARQSGTLMGAVKGFFSSGAEAEQMSSDDDEDEDDFPPDDDDEDLDSTSDGSDENPEVVGEVEQLAIQEEEGEELESEQEQDPDRITIHEETLTREDVHWNIKLGAVHLAFPRDAVSEPTRITVHRWRPTVLCPPLQEHEALVSNVIEISSSSQEAFTFKAEVKISFTHSSPGLHGYELVLCKLIHNETAAWEEVIGVEDFRTISDFEEEYKSSHEIPNLHFPVVQADITECAIYAVVSRLHLSPEFTITPNGGSFIMSDYPSVSVIIPKKAVTAKTRILLRMKVQEVPGEEFEVNDILIGPVLRIVCDEMVEFLKPVTITLPVSLGDTHHDFPDPTTCRVRILFLRSDGEQKEWLDITEDLKSPVTFDGLTVKFQVERFSGYSCLIDWSAKSPSYQGVIGYLSSLIWTQPQLAVFFAYFPPDDRPDSQDILYLICCPPQLREKVRDEITNQANVPTPSDSSSRIEMIPGRDKAYVSLTGGIRAIDEDDMEEFHLQFISDDLHKVQVPVRVIDDKGLSGVKFFKTPNFVKGTLLCQLSFRLSPLKRKLKVPSQLDVATTSKVEPVQEHPHLETLKVTLLGEEWTSLGGGLSTLNRELAKHLAKHPAVEVTVLVPKGACTQEDKDDARRNKVKIIEAKKCVGYEPRDWLICPPEDFNADVVFGHGIKFGRQTQFLKRPPYNCKWIQVVHTASEELAKYKGYDAPITKGERKRDIEVALCKEAHLVVPVGPKLREQYSSYLASKPDGDIVPLTPGLFEEFENFPNLNKDSEGRFEFKVLLCGRGDSEDFELKGYDIAAQAFACGELRETRCCLLFVGVRDGEQDEKTQLFLSHSIDKKQLYVRRFVESRALMKDLLCEVDLAIMPSRTEGFGLVSLEALSSGLPFLVGNNSGFAQAIRDLPNGKAFIVDSEEPKEWATAIATVQKEHRKYIQKIKELREAYGKKYSWKEQCETLVDKMKKMIQGVN